MESYGDAQPNRDSSFEVAVRAVARVEQRMKRAASVLHAARVPYAIAGESAVRIWVRSVDEAATRFGPEVEILLRRTDFEDAKQSLNVAGFVHQRVAGNHVFLECATAALRDAVRMVFVNEGSRAHETSADPDATESVDVGELRVLSLDPLVRTMLTSFRDKDRVHLRDLIGVGLVDDTRVARLPPVLGERLKQLLDTPDG